MVDGDDAYNLASLVVLSAGLSLDDLRQRIPLVPDGSWAKGSPRGRQAGSVQPFTGVSFESRLDGPEPPALHLRDLTERLEEVSGGVRGIAEEMRADGSETGSVRIWLHVDGGTPDRARADLSVDDLQPLADLGADLCVTLGAVQPVTAPPLGAAGAELVLPGETYRAPSLRALLESLATERTPAAGRPQVVDGRPTVNVHVHASPGDEAGLVVTIDQIRAFVALGTGLGVTADFPSDG